MARNSLNVLRSKIPRMRARPRRFVAEIRIGVPVGTLIKHRGGGIATAPQIRDSRLKMTERKRERERERERERGTERERCICSPTLPSSSFGGIYTVAAAALTNFLTLIDFTDTTPRFPFIVPYPPDARPTGVNKRGVHFVPPGPVTVSSLRCSLQDFTIN